MLSRFRTVSIGCLLSRRALIVLPCFAATMLAESAAVQAPLEKPGSGLINPRAIVYNGATHKIYAVDATHNAVEIYDERAVTHHAVKVGAEPVSIATDPVTGRVYIANSGDGSVTVLDGVSDAVVATAAVGSHPYSIAANPATNRVYVTHTFGDQLTVLDGKSDLATDVKTGSSDLIAINEATNTIYLLGYGSAVKVVDGANHKIADRPIGDHGWALTIDESIGAVYATRIESSDVAVLDGGLGPPRILHAGAIPCAIAIKSSTNTLYVANYGENTVSVVDGRSGRIVATVPVGSHPKAVAYDPLRDLVFVANTLSGTVTVIDAAANAVIATLAAGKAPYALAVVPGSNRLYVANESDESSSSIVDLRQIGNHTP